MKIADIKIGDRARDFLGNIDSLAKSISTIGLLHPIVVTENGQLISGSRRIAAFAKLGRDEIPTTVVDNLDDAALALIAERDENVEREPLKPTEMLCIAGRLKPFEQAEAKKRELEGGKHSGKSRRSEKFTDLPDKGNASDKIAAAVGTSRPTLKKIEEVVAAAEQDPATFAPVVEEMDRTGKVDRAHKKVKGVRMSKEPRDEFAKMVKTINSLIAARHTSSYKGIIRKLSEQSRRDFSSQLNQLVRVLNQWIEELEK